MLANTKLVNDEYVYLNVKCYLVSSVQSFKWMMAMPKRAKYL